MPAAVFIFSLATSGLAQTSKVPPIVIYSPHGTEILKMVADKYEKKYPGEKVDWRFYGAEDIVARIEAEKSSPVADVWWGGPQFMFIGAKNAGLLAELPKSLASNFEKDPGKHTDFWIGDMQAPITIFFQKDMLSKLPRPSDWDSLLDKKYAGKITLRTSNTSGTMRALIVAAVDWNLRRGKTLEQSMDWLKQLDAQVGGYYSHSQLMLQAVGKGILPIGVWNMPEVAMRMRQGFSLDFVYPSSGVPVLIDGMALVKKPVPHPSAQKFAEFLLSKDVAITLSRSPFHRLHLHKDLPLKEQPSYTRHVNFKVMDVDWERIAKEGPAWLKIWDEIFDSKKVKR